MKYTSQNFLVIKYLRKQNLIRLKTIILKSITKDIEVLIKNELLRNKSTLADKSNDDIYRKGINMLREGLKSKILSSETLNYKRNKSKSISVQPIHHACVDLKLTYYQQIIQLLLKMFITTMMK